MRILRYTLFLFAIGLISCEQEFDKKEQQSDCCSFQNLPKYPEQVVNINVHNYIPDMGDKVLSSPSHIHTRASEIISETLWDNGFGKTIHAQADESIVLDNLNRYIYPGSILDGASVANQDYKTISVHYKPINVSVSFPAQKVTGVLEKPSLSSCRQLVMDLMHQKGIGQQSASVHFDIHRFTSYDELKMTFGSNANTSFLFWGSSSSQQEHKERISKSSGLYIRFIQKYFTIDMDIPEKSFIEGSINAQYSPVYVSSIAYGRVGILTLETDEIYENAESIVKKAVNGFLYNKKEFLTVEEKGFFDEARMKVYVGGGNGDSGVKTLTGFDDFIKFISEGGHFSAETPGKPIFCSFAYLSDHSPYKVKFKIDIDSDPVYARIEYRNLKNDSYVGRSLQREKIIGDVHLAFYADRTAKIPTVAPRYISFNIVEHSRHYLKARIPRTEKDDTTVEEFVKSNNSCGTELQLKHDLLLTEFVWTHNNPRRTRYEQNTFRYSLSEVCFYTILPAINEPKKWR